jgi:hypothetical protein
MVDDVTPEDVAVVSRVLRSASYHEAGHAVVAIQLGRGVRYVTITPMATDEGGRTQYYSAPNVELTARHPWRYRAVPVISLAGPAAEARFRYRDLDEGAIFAVTMGFASPTDRVHAELYVKHGLGALSDLEADAHMLAQRYRTHTVVASWWAEIEAVAEELYERKRLTGRQVKEICDRIA